MALQGLPVRVRVNARLQEGQLPEVIEGLLAELFSHISPASRVVGTSLEVGPHGEPRAAVAQLEVDPHHAERVITAILDLEGGLPRGSSVAVNGAEAPFGRLEGLAVYLNGTQLDPEVYAVGDLQATLDALAEATADSGRLWSYWMGPLETALYFYGPDANALRAAIVDAAAELPLLERCRYLTITPDASPEA